MMLGVLALLGVPALFSMLACYFAVRRIAKCRWLVAAPRQPRSLAGAFCWLIAVVAFPFAWFFGGLVIGGNVGGALAGETAENFGLPLEVVGPIGVGLGVILCTTSGTIIAAVGGLLVARLIERLVIRV